MKKRSFGVFGLGEFGKSVAVTLAQGGQEVLAVDIKDDEVQSIGDIVTMAVKADVSDSEVMRSLGIANLDCVIIAIGNDLEASIMATIIVKEAGVKYVLAKANNDLHAKVLKKVGADDIIFPEKAMGVRIARSLVLGVFIDIIELSSKFSMVEVVVPENWVGKSLRELNIRNKFGFNVIAKKDGENINMNLDPDRKLERGDTYIIVGENNALEKIKK